MLASTFGGSLSKGLYSFIRGGARHALPALALAAHPDLADVRSLTAGRRIVREHDGASMEKRSRAGIVVLTVVCLSLDFRSLAQTRAQLPVQIAAQKGTATMMHASGTFDVKLVPQPPEDKAEASTLARMSIDKQFHGDLEATGKGQMLTAGTDVKGSAGYVAI